MVSCFPPLFLRREYIQGVSETEMNAALIYSQEELLRWDGASGKDRWGTYQIITGYEGTGACFWCGEELEGKRRFCGHRSGHWTLYANHFYWTYARTWCIKRYDHRCANCSKTSLEVGKILEESGVYYSPYSPAFSLQAHHIISLKGEIRDVTPYNLPWNLICLCHYCHISVHAAMRGVSLGTKLTKFDRAVASGQLTLGGVV